MKKIFLSILVIFVTIVAPTSSAIAAVESTTRVVVGSGPWGVVVSPDGSKTFVVNNEASPPSVSVIDNSNRTVIDTIILTGVTSAYGIAITPDGSKIVVTNPIDNKIVSILTSAPYTQSLLALHGGSSIPLQVAISPDGQFALVTCNASNSVSKVQLTVSGTTSDVLTGQSPVGIARKPGTNLYYSVNQDGNSLTIIDGTSMTSAGTISLSVSNPYGISITPDGSKAFVTGPVSNQVAVVSLTSNSEISTLSTGNYPQGIAVSTDGSKVYVANTGSGTVDVFDSATYTKLETAVSDYTPTEIAVNPINDSIWVSKHDDASVDNINFIWPQPSPEPQPTTSPEPQPTSPQLPATGMFYQAPVVAAILFILSGLVTLGLRNSRISLSKNQTDQYQ